MHQFSFVVIKYRWLHVTPSRSGYDRLVWFIEEEVKLLWIRAECTRIGTQEFPTPNFNIDSSYHRGISKGLLHKRATEGSTLLPAPRSEKQRPSQLVSMLPFIVCRGENKLDFGDGLPSPGLMLYENTTIYLWLRRFNKHLLPGMFWMDTEMM
jgi:hypothetical protein